MSGILGELHLCAPARLIFCPKDREACLVRRPTEHFAPSLRARRRRAQGRRSLPAHAWSDHIHAYRGAQRTLRPRHRLKTGAGRARSRANARAESRRRMPVRARLHWQAPRILRSAALARHRENVRAAGCGLRYTLVQAGRVRRDRKGGAHVVSRPLSTAVEERMAHSHVIAGEGLTQAQPKVRTIGLSDLTDALARGWGDFTAMPSHAVFLCLI